MKMLSMAIVAYVSLCCVSSVVSSIPAETILDVDCVTCPSWGKTSNDTFRIISLPGFGEKGAWPLCLADQTPIYVTKWYSRGASIEICGVFYPDGSRMEIAYRPDGLKGTIQYQRGKWAYGNKEGEIGHSGNRDLVGIRIQFFPDRIDHHRYDGNHPCMVIYVFRDGNNHQLEFSPDGKMTGDFWFGPDKVIYFKRLK